MITKSAKLKRNWLQTPIPEPGQERNLLKNNKTDPLINYLNAIENVVSKE